MAVGHGSATAPTVTLVQLPNGQTVQVHGVIQASQPSVIQSPQLQTVQVRQLKTSISLDIDGYRLNVIDTDIDTAYQYRYLSVLFGAKRYDVKTC